MRAPFTNITALALFFPANHGDEEVRACSTSARAASAHAHAPPSSASQVTSIGYIGLQGDHTHGKREAVHATYEVLCTHGHDELTSHSHEHSHAEGTHGHSHDHNH